MEIFNHVKERKMFYSGFVAGFGLVFGIYWVVLAVPLVVADWIQGNRGKYAMTTCFLTALALWLLPCWVFWYGVGQDNWGFALAVYVCSLSFFHLGEFYVQSFFHFQDANFSSKGYAAFLIDHSREYTIAIIVAFTEHFSKLIIPYPVFLPVCWIGIVITSIGHIFRIGSEVNCGRNFSHKIRFSKKDDHELVTSGFYT